MNLNCFHRSGNKQALINENSFRIRIILAPLAVDDDDDFKVMVPPTLDRKIVILNHLS